MHTPDVSNLRNDTDVARYLNAARVEVRGGTLWWRGRPFMTIPLLLSRISRSNVEGIRPDVNLTLDYGKVVRTMRRLIGGVVRRVEDLVPDEIGRLIGKDPYLWEGNCFATASQIVEAGLVEEGDRAVYGCYHGDVAADGYWASRSSEASRAVGLHHGWILTTCGYIIDPTRWSFEGRPPYLAIIFPDEALFDDYDAGCNRTRMANIGPCPEPDGRGDPRTLELDEETRIVVDSLIQPREDGTYHDNQVFWLCNLAPVCFKGRAKEAYDAIIDAGWGGYIPLDNRREHASK